MKHSLGRKVPGRGNFLGWLFFHPSARVQNTIGNVFLVWRTNTAYSSWYAIVLSGAAGEQDFPATRHTGGKCLPRRVYNSREERLSTSFRHIMQRQRRSTRNAAVDCPCLAGAKGGPSRPLMGEIATQTVQFFAPGQRRLALHLSPACAGGAWCPWGSRWIRGQPGGC